MFKGWRQKFFRKPNYRYAILRKNFEYKDIAASPITLMGKVMSVFESQFINNWWEYTYDRDFAETEYGSPRQIVETYQKHIEGAGQEEIMFPTIPLMFQQMELLAAFAEFLDKKFLVLIGVRMDKGVYVECQTLKSSKLSDNEFKLVMEVQEVFGEDAEILSGV